LPGSKREVKTNTGHEKAQKGEGSKNSVRGSVGDSKASCIEQCDCHCSGVPITRSTCVGRTNRPRLSTELVSETAGLALRSRFKRSCSTSSESPSLFLRFELANDKKLILSAPPRILLLPEPTGLTPLTEFSDALRTASTRLLRAARSSVSSSTKELARLFDALLPISKYRTPRMLPSFQSRPSSRSADQPSETGTSTPTHGPSSPSTLSFLHRPRVV